MKFSTIGREQVIAAAHKIDKEGVPKDNVWSQYYVVVDGKEYPFKYLMFLASENGGIRDIDFQSNEYYREYVEKLGFEITYHPEGYNFFTKEELDFYSSIAGKEYRKNSLNQKYYRQKLSPLLAKINYWAEQLVIGDFKVRKSEKWLTGYTSNIVPYFWPRIYKGEDKDIFFNVEVNGDERFIGYKLDGYYKTAKALSEKQQEILNAYKQSIKLDFPQIGFDKISKYTWENLIRESREYIQKHLADYDILKKILWKETKIARIIWNTNKWIKPSGQRGKAVSESFEKESGFGHEEWLLDADKVIEGVKYGFLEPVHKHRSTYEGKIFDILLYTYDSENKQRYWVGELKDVEVLTEEESERILAFYRQKGWYDEMKNDLRDLNIPPSYLEDWVKSDPTMLFNIKFTVSQIRGISPELIPISESDDVPCDRYILMNCPLNSVQKFEQTVKRHFSFADSGSKEADLAQYCSRKSCVKELELKLKHNKLQSSFLVYLQSKYGKDCVKRECVAYGGSRIDVVREIGKKEYIFYEIKTYGNLRTSIRESLGQLFEYCFYPDVEHAKQLILVSDLEPSEEERNYLQHIKKYIKIPFNYVHFNIEEGKVISEI